MKATRSPWMQLRSIVPAILLILAISAVFVGSVLILHLWKGIRIDQLTRDPAAIMGARPYIGFLSNVGIFFWSATTTVYRLGSLLMAKKPNSLELKGFLLASGLFTLFLGFDDTFQLHEDLLPNHLGIWEPLTYVGYAGLGLFYMVRFYSVILDTDYLLLGLALFLLGFSASLDVVWDQHIIAIPSRIEFLVEDGAKFTGIVSWLVYSARVVNQRLSTEWSGNAKTSEYAALPKTSLESGEVRPTTPFRSA